MLKMQLLLNIVFSKPMNNKKKFLGAGVAVLAVATLAVGLVKAQGSFWELVAQYTGLALANKIEVPADIKGSEGAVGAAGDTYQSAKVYSKVITSNSTTPASIPCANWLVKGVDFYVAPSTTANFGTTTINVGISSSTTGIDTSLVTDTYSTSTAVYQTYVQADGAGQLCTSGSYVNVQFGVATTTSNGVLNVEYLIYQ